MAGIVKKPHEKIEVPRSQLPGISRKFDPVSAQKVYKEKVKKEMERLDEPRDRYTGCKTRQLCLSYGDSEQLVTCLQHVSYCDVGGPELPESLGVTTTNSQASKTRAKKIPKVPNCVTWVPHSAFPPGPERDRIEEEQWEQRYNFFSRPPNPYSQDCHKYESYRMKHLFPLFKAGVNDPILRSEDALRDDAVKMAVARGGNLKADFERVLAKCEVVAAQSQAESNARGEAAYAGYEWPKYKYFTSGAAYPVSGCLDRLLGSQAKYLTAPPDSFLRSGQNVPQVRRRSACP